MDARKEEVERWDESASAKWLVHWLESCGFKNVSFNDTVEYPNAKKVGLRRAADGGFSGIGPADGDPVVASMVLGSAKLSIRVCRGADNADGTSNFLYYVRGDSRAEPLAGKTLKEDNGGYVSVETSESLGMAVHCACYIACERNPGF